MNTCLLLLFGTLAWAGTAEAQARGQVHGTVVDETHGAIVRAAVTLIGIPAGTPKQTHTDGAGRFAVNDVVAGDYVLRVVAAGFQDADLTLTVGREAPPPVTITMQVGGLEEQVTVVGSRAGPPTRADQNADAVGLDRDFLGQLPLDGNDVMALVSTLLAPSAGGIDGPSVIIDGVEGSALDLSASAIRHITVNRNPYSAEFRRPGKDRVEVATEHGSRKVRGTASFTGRTAALDARNALAQTKAADTKQLVDGSAGGPLFSERAVFFVNGSWLRHDESAIVHARTLTGSGFLDDSVSAPKDHLTSYGRVDFKTNARHSVMGRYDATADWATNRGVGGVHLADQAYDSTEGKHRLQVASHDLLATLINDVRLNVERHDKRDGRRATAPAVIVHGAFTGGPSQMDESSSQTELQLQEVGTIFRGAHTVRFGAEARIKRVDRVAGSDFGGTFEFASLDQFARGTPILFRIARGDPNIDFSQRTAFGFVQDEIHVRNDLSLVVGMREDWQGRPGPGVHLAPRASLTWAPGNQQTVLRAGAGTFSDRLSDGAIGRAGLFDGDRLRELVIVSPAYPDPSGPAAQTLIPNVVRIQPDLRSPELLQASVAVERELWGKTRVSLDYTMLRGSHLFRSRDLNPPLDMTAARLDGAFLNVAQIETTAALRSDALTLGFNGQVTRRFTGVVHYTWSKTVDDTSSLFDLPADSANLAAEHGPADHDRRHRLRAVGTFTAGAGVRLGVLATVESGAPFNITTGFDQNRDGVVRDRPLGVTRNSGQGPGQAQIDLRVTKVLPLRPSAGKHPDRHANVQLTLDAFNVFNATNFSDVIGVQTSPLFGQPTKAKPARTIQLSARYRF